MTESRHVVSSTSAVPPISDLPRHVAIIMDGNGRWARQRGLPRVAGHRKGADAVRQMVQACGERGIACLTLFAFSSENWRRPQAEVSLLLDLFLTTLEKEVKKLHANNVRFSVIGDIERFGPKIVARIREGEALTAANTGLVLTIAANYGGRWDIAQACRQLATQAVAGAIDPAAITPEQLEPHLSMAGLPEPDLFIRTGGEQRISNFLLWQLAYTELYFTPVLWPDFDAVQFNLALQSFAGRQRRFGQTGEQVEAQRDGKAAGRNA
jgi:undecaprenyl diphosphate synthase